MREALICSGHPWKKVEPWNLTPSPTTPALPHITHTRAAARARTSAYADTTAQDTIFTTVILFSTKTVLYYIEVRRRARQHPDPAPQAHPARGVAPSRSPGLHPHLRLGCARSLFWAGGGGGSPRFRKPWRPTLFHGSGGCCTHPPRLMYTSRVDVYISLGGCVHQPHSRTQYPCNMK